MRTRSRRTALVVTAALAAPLVVCAVLAPFRDDVANTNVALVLVLVVVGAAATGRRTAGIGAALSSGVWFDFFLTEPYHQLTITDRTDVETTVLLLVGVSVTEIALWGRREQARSSRRVGFLAGFVSSARLVAAADTPPSVLITHVQRQIVEALDIDECRFDTATGGAHPRLHADGSVTSGGSLVDVERDGLPTGDRIELLIEHAGTVHGRFLLDATTRVRRPDVDQRVIAVTLAQLVGAALATPRSGDRRT